MIDLKAETTEKLESLLFTIDGRGAQVKREVYKELLIRKLKDRMLLSPEEYSKAMDEAMKNNSHIS
jgi:hypothetical protein